MDGGTTLSVDPSRGGRLVSLCFDGLEVLGGAQPDPDDDPSFYDGAFPMAPFASCLPGGSVTTPDGTFRVPASDRAGNVFHGLVHNVRWHVRALDDRHVQLTTDLDARWPVGARVELEWTVTDGSAHAVLGLTPSAPTPAVLGFHPWFRRHLARGGAAVVSFSAARWVETVDDIETLRSTEPARPRDAVAVGVLGDPLIVWPGALKLTSHSEAATAWIVCETEPEVLCIEPLTATPASAGGGSSGTAAELFTCCHPLTLDWVLTADSQPNQTHSKRGS